MRFTADGDTPGNVRVELAAGRGESLPAGGGALAQLQFEVLAGSGSTQIGIGNSSVLNAESGSVALPDAQPAELEVK